MYLKAASEMFMVDCFLKTSPFTDTAVSSQIWANLWTLWMWFKGIKFTSFTHDFLTKDLIIGHIPVIWFGLSPFIDQANAFIEVTYEWGRIEYKRWCTKLNYLLSEILYLLGFEKNIRKILCMRYVYEEVKQNINAGTHLLG